MNNGFIKVEEEFILIPKFNKLNIIGDPGCDGLGAATMSVFAKAIYCLESDLCIIAGDLVPYGSRKIYKNVKQFIDNIAPMPCFSLCGNHDTDFYSDYFGLKNYCLYNDEISIIMLDNSKRFFSEKTLNFCRQALEKNSSENVLVLFHIPPPNNFTCNSIAEENWNKLQEVYKPFKDKIKYFICGHVHSYFEDVVDGIPLIVTGGGGARIEYVSDRVERKNIKNHILQLSINKRKLIHSYISIDDCRYDREIEDKKLQTYLENSFRNEAAAYFKYRFLADVAEERNLPNLAKLFSALSKSEYYHAKNHFSVSGMFHGVRKGIEESIKNEDFEINKMYNENLNYCQDNSYGLSSYTFFDALEAEKVHKPLLEEALLCYSNEQDMPEYDYYICSSCGYTFCNKNKPDRCPVCGAPKDKIKHN